MRGEIDRQRHESPHLNTETPARWTTSDFMFSWIRILSFFSPEAQVGVHVILCAPEQTKVLHHNQTTLGSVSEGSSNPKDLIVHPLAQGIDDGACPQLSVGGWVVNFLNQKTVEGWTEL